MKKQLSILQILILLVGTIAIAYAIGSSVGVVEASNPGENQEKITPVKETPQLENIAVSLTASPLPSKIIPKVAIPKPLNVEDEIISDISNPVSVTKKAQTEKWINRVWKGPVGQIIGNAGIAGGIYAGIKWLGPLFVDDTSLVDATSKAIAIGYFTGTSLHTLGIGGALSTPIGIGLGAVIFLATYKRTQEQRIEFMCEVWDAPTGGANCEKCNEGILPCTEYQCKALGQSCELINQGTGEEQCVWQNRNDASPPVIQPWDDALKDSNYSYNPDSSISPPNRGVYVEYKRGCIEAFTPFTFGVILDEPAKCKLDTEQKQTFDDMAYYFGGSSTAKYNHTQTISLPSPESLESENITLQNDGEFTLYTKCQDSNGNFNTADFVFKYCVDEGPDTTAPVIVATSLRNTTKVPVAYNQSSFYIELYVNEPADCRWTHDADADFSNMGNEMACATGVFKMNAQMLYICSTTLTGIVDKQDNKFYFRCKDKPNASEEKRFANAQGYLVTLTGTQPIVITEYGPTDETIKGSGNSVRVTLEAETAAGYDKGISTCYYSSSCFNTDGSKTDYADILGEKPFDSHSHTEDIFVAPGDYDCSIKCLDEGGNTDYAEFEFSVEVDEAAPIIVRAYHAGTNLKIRTDEEAGCVYSTTDCMYLFEDGEPMISVNELDHTASWNSQKTYYIKCQDEYTNEPYPNECSIILRPSENY